MRIIASVRNLFKIPELRRRIVWTLGLLAVFRVGSHISLPGVNPDALRAFAEAASQSMGSLWSFLELVSGGAIGNLALFSLGIAPYITASILIQLLTKASPRLEALSKEGAAGQRRIQQITRFATVPVCLLQAIVAASHLVDASARGAPPLLVSTGIGARLLLVGGLTAGALFVLWLADQITERGLGNGPSVLIMAGIASRLPVLFGEMTRRVEDGAVEPAAVLLIGAFYLAAVAATVFVSQAQRRIPLQHAKHIRGRKMSLGEKSFLPLRLNTAGVMPVIFASTVLVVPAMLALVPGLGWMSGVFRHAGFLFTLFYLVAILFFSYVWTYLFFRPDEIALQLKENGSFVPGLRPGEATAGYLNGILVRITLCGAAFLAATALFPAFFARALRVDDLLEAFLGGSGLLIVVGVGLDLLQKAESYLLLHHYEGFLGPRARIRGRR